APKDAPPLDGDAAAEEPPPGAPFPELPPQPPAQMRPEPTMITRPTFMHDVRLRRGWCNEEVIADRARLRGKSQQKYRCDRCNVHIAQLSREFGEFPSSDFKRLCEETQQAFFKDVRDVSSGKMAVAKVKELMRSYENHEGYYAEGGEFPPPLPIGAWSTRGFDAALIEANSLEKDKRQRRVLGATYRVPILSGGHRGARGTERPHVAEASHPSKKIEKTTVADADEEFDEGPSDDDDSDSSSDSSSSSDDKKNKKNKKANNAKKQKKKAAKKERARKEKDRKKALEEKERAKQERKAAVESRKVAAANGKLADSIEKKVTETLTAINRVAGHRLFPEFRQSIKDDMDAFQAKLQCMSQDIEKVQNGVGSSIRYVSTTAEAK
ncbi:unnamed protein product, partial [Prorocentrum cordatum]